ncbi:macrolide-inactivating glycosyltransferase [Pilimelia terevasa]|uniref:Macrolide-inactivating glycosyltransferase n=1 Tax=Pilimelia terevasa TaxID=53372 RepID=A0A8J3BM66_9ACTN|nr:macrolide family glycosyltransferase [Pilimelia terevasa]GGK31552.1 macrolide-inactivating glycosyltransferase [Pilimelia terevasa]
MSHIAMCGVPAVSHVLPSLDLIRELVLRGHRVTYANGTTVADLIAPTGATLVPIESTLPIADNDWPDNPIGAMRVFLDDNIQALPQLHAYYDFDPADLYLYDIGCYAARALAESQGQPIVQLSPTYVAWEDFAGTLPGADGFGTVFSDWLAFNGATTTNWETFMGRPSRALALIPRAMQPFANQVDEQAVTFVGPCLGPRESWTRPHGDDKVLLVSLGSAYTRQPEFYRQCVAAFGNRRGWHAVLQIGKYVDRTELGAIPPNIDVQPWVPQLAILEHADAFITHAGMGSSSEALWTATPVIAVPQAVDQFTNADKLVELGVGRRLDAASATAQILWQTLEELTGNASVLAHSAQLRAEARAEGGTARAADILEAILL